MSFSFTRLATDGAARAGLLQTPHGEVETPVFMPVGTAAAVKGVAPDRLRSMGAGIVLANTYHLALRPGADLVERQGGVAAFMGWHGPTLTDSGGYQVFSLAERRVMTDEGVCFKSHIDGSDLFLSPEESIRLQQQLGADIIMAFDDCAPADASRSAVAESMARTHAWAARSKEAWTARDRQALFGIVQGGRFADLRTESAAAIAALDLPGSAIGGVSVGEGEAIMNEAVGVTAPLLPDDKPRYLMGVGRPQDLLRYVGMGIDMFDCVLPTRNGRNAQALTRQGPLHLRNARFRDDNRPIEEDCDCYACRTVSRAYLRHLFMAKEMLGPVYASLHNIRFLIRLMEDARGAIREGRYAAFAKNALSALAAGEG